MPPTIGHFRQNPPNTFQPFPPAHHQASHFQHQTTNFPTHNIGNHPTFPSAVPHQNGHSNIFAPSLTNSAIASNFATAGALGSAGGTGLASHEAQMRFAHGAALQQQAAEAGASLTNQRGAGMPTRIREVWSNNLAQEMSTIRTLVDRYPFVSMVRGRVLSRRRSQLTVCRIPSFLESSLGQSATSLPKPIIITNV